MSFRATLTRLRQGAINSQHTPNAPLQLDPALSQLLHDTDLSLLRKFRHGSKHYVERPELQVEEADAFSNLPPEYEGYDIAERGEETQEASYWDGPREERRSPAAVYGTKHVGMVVLPWELEHAVGRVVEESDKHQLRSDAKRLFLYPTPANTQPTTSSSGPSKLPRHRTEGARSSNLNPEWQLTSTAASLSFSTKGNYKTIVQLGPREGLAFTTVAMPAHYAATANVFREISRRMLGPGKGGDRIESVVDFGGKSGQGLWAALIAFREPIPAPEPKQGTSDSVDENANPVSWTPISASPHHLRVGPSSTSSIPSPPVSVPETPVNDSASEHGQSWTASTVKKYMLLDSRRSLTELARRLVKGVDIGECQVLYQDFWGKNTRPPVPERSLALCAFTLSELPNGTSRKRMVTEMWESGAEWMVIIDHGNATGFDSVAQARELLLELGRQESNSQSEGSAGGLREQGSHVVAPCPHSHACPLHSSPNTRDICHFTQRVQTPPFMRHTKHSREGHEDVTYSYVVIRRGKAPMIHHTQKYGSSFANGLVGAVGRESAEKALLDEDIGSSKRRSQTKGKGKERRGRQVLEVGADGVWSGLVDTGAMERELGGNRSDPSQTLEPAEPSEELSEEEALHSGIRTWPRIIYPPMKRSGHVIMDTCTSEGSIARITIPRSQGKQAYYDARKANWGDAFPHPPRITPLIRTRGIRRLGPAHSPTTADGSNIESEPSGLYGLGGNDAIEEDRIDGFEIESGAESSRKTIKAKARRKSLREARRRAADTDLARADPQVEDWLNKEAGELAARIQAEMEQKLAESRSEKRTE
ncbi:unnamed protein product [Rhizoctonia solani]|uniref:Uncharacterized protein n=1 Tax=Rhizoctonia solani TaxID=456999 RepID=A0A8H3AUW6_9AGAM|nr:unnamed protein product [Rhizoctonia solani]CAE6488627.1 unnamed protein product [Rhizoctonia solani]